MRNGHLVGITPAGTPDFDLLAAAGFRWLREGVGFPFEDKINGTLRPGYVKALQRTRDQHARGFRVLASTPGPGSSRYDPATKQTTWHPGLPAWAGTHEDDSYYDAVEASCARVAADTVGLIDYWQVANEPDIDIFRGPLTDAHTDHFLLASARGLKRGNPAAQVGINLGGPNGNARRLAKNLYEPTDSPFDYIGLDGYFGSWQRGGPENWPAYIDEAHSLTRGRPVIIAEWGYSSLQQGPITDDPQRLKPYNQDVCRTKRWGKAWRTAHTPEEQADYARAAVQIFADHPAVLGNFFFRYGDTAACWQCGQPDCPAECAWGMVDVHGRPKPVYAALCEANAACFARN